MEGAINRKKNVTEEIKKALKTAAINTYIELNGDDGDTQKARELARTFKLSAKDRAAANIAEDEDLEDSAEGEDLNLGKKNLSKKRATEAAFRAYEISFNNGSFDRAMEIAKDRELGEGKVKAAARKLIEVEIETAQPDLTYIAEIAKEANLGKKDITAIGMKVFETHIGRSSPYYVANMAERLGGLRNKKEIVAMIAKEYERNIKNGYYKDAAEVADAFELGKDKVKAAAMKAYEKKIEKGSYRDAREIAQEFNLGDEPVKAAVRKEYEKNVKEGDYERALEIAEYYRHYRPAEEEQVKAVAKKVFETYITWEEEAIRDAKEVAKRNHLDKNYVMDEARKEYEKRIKNEDYQGAIDILKTFNLGGDELVKATAEEGFKKYIEDGSCDEAKDMVHEGHLDPEYVKEVAMREYLNNIKNRDYGVAAGIAETFKLGENLVKKAEMLEELSGFRREY